MTVVTARTSTQTYSTEGTTDRRAMAIATALFFMWGCLTCLNDILIPHLKSIFSLSYAQAMLVQFAFFSAYFLFALPAGKLVERSGYKQTMVIGLLVMASGALLFLPASTMTSFPLFLSALVILAAGTTCLQVAANPYVAHLGPERTAASRLNFSQAFNSLGTTVAPLIGGSLILGAATMAPDVRARASAAVLQSYRMQQASSVRLPYLGIAITLVLLAAALAWLKLPANSHQTQDIRPDHLEKISGSNDTLWNHPWLLLGAVGIFLYVGAEVSIGSFLVNYLGQPNIMAMPERTAAHYIAWYWGGAMTGRFLGAAILQKLRTGVVLSFAAAAAFLLLALSIATSGPIAMWSILAICFFNSVMFPNILTLGLTRLGRLTSKGSSLMVAAIVGGALVPLLEGFVADDMGIQHAFLIPAACYLFIAGFGFAARNLLTSSDFALVAV